MQRIQVSKGLRFAVLQRDAHTCHYCGGKAPDVKLTVDHVIPTSAGGTNEPDNLVAACIDCNAGKGSGLSLRPVDNTELAARLEAFKERRKLLRGTLKAERENERIQTERAWIVAEGWCKGFHSSHPDGKMSIDKRLFSSIRHFLITLPLETLLDQVTNCAGKWLDGYLRSEQDAMKYFCATLRNIRQRQEAQS